MSSSAFVPFQELEDSPKITLSRGGHNITRRFVMPWDYVTSFITNLTVDGPGGKSTLSPLPFRHTYVSSIEAGPYTPDHPPDPQAINNPVIGINTYIGRGISEPKALVVVSYELDYFNRPWPSSIPKPAIPAHTSLRLSVRTSGQFLTVPGRSAKWDGVTLESTASSGGSGPPGPISNKPVPPDVGIRHLITIQDLKLEWYYLKTTLNTTVWDDKIGTVNIDPILGAPAQCLLFEGWDLDEDISLDPESPFCLKATLNFKRRIHNLGSAGPTGFLFVTWNMDYRDSVLGAAGGWTVVKMSNDKLRYQPTPFSTLFSGVTP